MSCSPSERLRAQLKRCLAVGCGALLLAGAKSEAATPILMVHSYSQEYAWTHGQHDGFVAALKTDPGVTPALSTEYLDTKRRAYDGAYAKAMADHLRIKYAGYRPAAIYVSDDDALLFARDYLQHLFPAAPIFFSGVNDYAVGQSLDRSRFTGVFEKKEVAPNLDWLLRLDPGLRTLVFVGDGSNTHAAVEREIRKDLAGYPRVQARFVGERRLDRMLERLRGEPSQTLFLTTLGGMTDAGGEVLPLADTLRALSQGGRRVVSMEDAYVRDGVLGGFVTHGARQGAGAARLVLDYLKGKPLAEIPPVLKSPNAYLFDDAVLEAQKLTLPGDIAKQATLLNPRAAFFDAHRTLIVGGLYGLSAALVLAILAALYIVLRKNRELTRANVAAEKSSRLLNEAVSSIEQGFTIYDEHDRLVICNEAYRDFYAASADLIVPGNRFEDIVRRGAERGQYTDAVGRIDEWVASRVAQHQAADGKVVEQRLGDGRWLLIVEHRTPSGFIAGNRIDITALKRATALIEDRNAQLDAIFQLSPDGLVSFDRAGNVENVNAAFVGTTGMSAAEIVGRSMEELERRLRELAEAPEQWSGLEACFLQPKVGAGGTAATAARPRHQLVLRQPRAAALDLLGITGTATAVGRLLYMHNVTREMEVDRLKSEFLSHAAHELRTPMASIFGFTELLINQEFDEATRRDLLVTIHKQTQWLVDIINELLDLARIEARRGKDFRIEAVPIAPLVGDTVAAMNIDSSRWPLTVECDSGPPSVWADEAKLRQALTNVLGNAVKYSPEGGAIEIRCAAHDREGKHHIGIAVTDHGVGMRPDQVARVGERFYRADTSGRIPGTGLGMAIVKEIVELHGGGFKIDSAVGAGTTVFLWLPAEPRAAERNAA
ncbi:ATP-binding protein [Sulfuritalea hydrogenivorans]|uniref:histidine kinase n=1 Tax=Sulfuritalea hydrogenivorans sk43H TaxID=1223802 RepID=W0SEZ0_9PROT|nr:ATP-binding protein [Sulfuritalea hydrogenivorans]BAO29626.1 PAS domain S-box [Sulfuritalea hydrogenivorans sk43H]